MATWSPFYSPLQRFYKFVLKRIVGNFLEDEIDLNNLEVQLTTGVVELRNLKLKTEVLNELAEDLPLVITSAEVKSVKATIPWRNILQDHCQVEIIGLKVTAVPACDQQARSNSGMSNSTVLERSLADLSKEELAKNARLHRHLQHRLEQEAVASMMDEAKADTDNTPDDSAADVPDADPQTDDSLQFVASFLERVISRTELVVKNVCVSLEHVVPATRQKTVLCVSLPWLSYSGVEDLPDNSAGANDKGKAQAPSSGDSSTLHDHVGPKFQYHKAIRFHGFRVELFQEPMDSPPPPERPTMVGPSGVEVDEVSDDEDADDTDSDTDSADAEVDAADTADVAGSGREGCTIIHGDRLQDCLIYVRVVMVQQQNVMPHIKFHCFIRSLRALLTPRQLALLVDLLSAVGASSAQVAAIASSRNRALPVEPAATPSSVSKWGSPRSVASGTTAASKFSLDSLHIEDAAAGGTDEEDEPQSVFEIWSLKVQVVNCSITLLESDESAYPTNWYLTPSPALKEHNAHSPLVEVVPSAQIAGLHSDHVSCVLRTIMIEWRQRSDESVLETSLGNVQLFEYLLRRLSEDALNSSDEDMGDVTDGGYARHRLASFQRLPLDSAQGASGGSDDILGDDAKEDAFVRSFRESAHRAVDPHVRVTMRTFMGSRALSLEEAGLRLDPQTHTDNSLRAAKTDATQHVVVQLHPVTIDVDLGFWDRLDPLLVATSGLGGGAPATAQGTASGGQPLGSLADSLDSLSQSPPSVQSSTLLSPGPSYMARVRQQHQNQTAPSDGSVVSCTLFAERAVARVSFPGTTTGVGASSKRADCPFVTRCGPLRDERLALSLRQVMACSQSHVEVLEDTEWNVSLHSVDVFYEPQPGTSKSILTSRCTGGAHGANQLRPQLHILSRVSRLSPQSTPHAGGNTLPDDQFFQELPSYRVWEPDGDAQAASPPQGAHGSSKSQRAFENACVGNSKHVLTVNLPTCSVTLTKAEYDAIMLLYNIAVEGGAPQDAAAASAEDKQDASKPPVLVSLSSGRQDADRKSLFYDSDEEHKGTAPPRTLEASGVTSTTSASADDKPQTIEFTMRHGVNLAASAGGYSDLIDDGDNSLTDSDDELAGDTGLFQSVLLDPDGVGTVQGSHMPVGHGASPPSDSCGYKHSLAVKLGIMRGAVCIAEHADGTAARKDNKTGTGTPQSFHIDITEMDLTQVVLFDGRPVTYLSFGCSDIVVREYTQAARSVADLYLNLSLPFLVRTVKLPPCPVQAPVGSRPAPMQWMFQESNLERQVLRATVVMEQKITQQTRDILAVMNLRGLTLLHVVSSQWMNKLVDFFTSAPAAPATAAARAGKASATPNSLQSTPMHSAQSSPMHSPRSVHSESSSDSFVSAPEIPAGMFESALDTAIHTADKRASTAAGAGAGAAAAAAAAAGGGATQEPAAAGGGGGSSDAPEDLVKLFVNAYSCAVDYNSPAIDSRIVVVLDNLRLSTHIVQSSPVLSLKVDVRDAAAYMIDRSEKVAFSGIAKDVQDLRRLHSGPHGGRPHAIDLPFGSTTSALLRHVGTDAVSSLRDKLEGDGFVRILTLDYLQAFIKMQQQRVPRVDGTSSLLDTVSTEVTNNLLTVLTCSDSFQTFIEVIDRFLVELNEAYPQNVQPIQGPDGCYVPDDTDEEDEKGHPAPAKDLASGKASPEFVPSAPVDIVGRSGGVVNELQSAMQDALAMTDPSLPSGPRSLPSALEYSYHGSSDDDDDDAKDAGVRMIDNYLQHLHLQQRRSKSQGHNRRHVPEQQARWFDDSVLDDAKALAASGPVIIDNHIQLPDEDDVSAEIKEIQDSIKDRSLKYPFPISETVLRDVNICWRMFGGSDWVREQKQRPAPASASASASASAKATAPSQEDVEVGTHIYKQSSVSHDYFSAGASPANDAPSSSSGDADTSSHDDKPRSGRRVDVVLEWQFIQSTLRFESYCPDEQVTGRTAIAFRDVVIVDLVDSSPYKHFARYYPMPGSMGRPTNSCMFLMELISVRPDLSVPSGPMDEYRLRMELLPLRLNVDQDTLEFLIAFIVGPSPAEPPAPAACSADDVMAMDVDEKTSGPAPGDAASSSAKKVVHEEDVPLSYFQSFTTTGVHLCIDYQPKRVDFKSLKDGDYVQLVHLFPLEEVQIHLTGLELHGVEGWGRLFAEMGVHWGTHIGKHQAHKYLSGVQPIRSLVKVGSGVADLVLIPVEQFQKDGRVLAGLQKGTRSFVRSVAAETIKVSTKLAVGTQRLLESVDRALGGTGPTHRVRRPAALGFGYAQRGRRLDRFRRSRNPPRFARRYSDSSVSTSAGHGASLANPPQDVYDGLRQAYQSLSRGLQVAAHHVVVVPREEYVRSGTGASIKSVVKAVPGAIIQPMIGATEALSKALLGFQHAVNTDVARDMSDKYKH